MGVGMKKKKGSQKRKQSKVFEYIYCFLWDTRNTKEQESSPCPVYCTQYYHIYSSLPHEYYTCP